MSKYSILDKQAAARYKVFEDAMDAVFVADLETAVIVDCNRAACELLERERDELIGMQEEWIYPPEYKSTLKEHISSNEGSTRELKVITKNGWVRDVAIKASVFEIGGKKFIHGAFRDITDRKRLDDSLRREHDELDTRVRERTAELERTNVQLENEISERVGTEEKLSVLNRTLGLLGSCHHAMIHAKEEEELINELCCIITKEGGYGLTWVGYADHDEKKSVRIAASAGDKLEYLKDIRITWADDLLGQGPTGTAIRTGKTFICREMMTDPRFAAWRDRAAKYQIQSSVAIPFEIDDLPCGVLSIYSLKPDAFDTDETNLLETLAADLAYGIRSLRLEMERRKALEALRGSEEEYRMLFDAAPVVIGITDFDGSLVAANRAAKAVFGFPDDYRDINLSQFYQDPDERLKLIQELKVAENVRDREIRFKRQDGSSFIALLNVDLITLSGQKKILACARDITERKESEDQLKKLNEDLRQRAEELRREISERKRAEEETKRVEAQLRQAHKMETIGTLAGGIAHDFNNILTPIINYTAMTLDGLPEDSPGRSYLNHVLLAAERAKNAVRQILTFSRSGQQEFKPLKIHKVVEEAIKLLKSSLPSTIEMRKTINSSSTVSADSTQIHQLMINLCTNAHHAMQNGGVIKISLDDVDVDAQLATTLPNLQPGRYVRLTISDTGHGMDEATTGRIFDPFFTTKGVGEGTGLGLSVVRGIVLGHGGEITVKSKPGKGTAFYVYFPISNSEPQEDIPAAATPAPMGKERILFVDDEEEISIIGKKILEGLGYKVMVINNGPEALKEFRANPSKYDLIVTDQTMPKMTGLQLATEVTGIRPDLPVILTSGFSEAMTPENLKKSGIRECMMKPYSFGDLAKTIRRVVDGNMDGSLQ